MSGWTVAGRLVGDNRHVAELSEVEIRWVATIVLAVREHRLGKAEKVWGVTQQVTGKQSKAKCQTKNLQDKKDKQFTFIFA